jgi:dolichol-phosphate mannosyltransferase
VSIVVPTFNEAGTLATLVEKIDHALVATVSDGYEIVLVDDGSTDESWAEMAAIARSNPRARAVRLRRNFGKAAAVPRTEKI